MMFKIEDTGAGIPDDLQRFIFDDFVTGNAAYDCEVGGTGLGLSIARRFIHLLGGEMWSLGSGPINILDATMTA
jgi:signal transduction histidine kinase